MVAGGVPVPVVDALEAVDVDEGDDEAPVAAPRAIDLVGQRQPAHLPAERSGQVVKVRAVQVGLQPLALASGLGSVGRGPCPICGGTSPVGFGAGPNVLELLGQGRIRLGDGALDRLGASVPKPGRFVARGRGRVAIGGRLSPDARGPGSTDMGRKPMDLGRLTLVARDLIGVHRRSPCVGG